MLSNTHARERERERQTEAEGNFVLVIFVLENLSEMFPSVNKPKSLQLNLHYGNMSVQYTAIFHGCKNGKFHMKKM